MNKNELKKLFPEGTLTEDTFDVIEETFNQRVQIHVEKALLDQDEQYAEKLSKLLEAIDKDRARKLVQVLEKKDRADTAKLKKVGNHFNKVLTKEAVKFKSNLVSTISQYMDVYLEEVIPTTDIKEAVRNKQALTVLEGLRSTLAVDSALMNDQVREAVIDGKQKLDEQHDKISQLERETKLLKESLQKTRSQLVLETKTSGMDKRKKDYIFKIFENKSAKIIEENFDYTSKLFDKKEQERIATIKEQAFTTRVAQHDAPKVIVESTSKKKEVSPEPLMNEYVSVLGGGR
jgi:hypothetical protein